MPSGSQGERIVPAMKSAPTGSRRLRLRPGVSLLEILVAILILGTALLGLARTGADALGAVVDARARGLAARAAERRIELLRAAGCAASSGGAVQARGVVEWWSAQSGGGWVSLRDSVAYRARGRRRAVVLTDRAPC